MYMPNLPCFSSSLFSYNKDMNTLVSEISTLARGNSHLRVGRIYDDACDVGIEIKSEKTGNKIKFYLEREVTDDEGDFQYWTFKPLEVEVNKNPALRGMMVTVFND